MIVQAGEKVHNKTSQRKKQYLFEAGVFIKPLQVYLLTDVSTRRKDKNSTYSHQKNDNHRDAVGDRIISRCQNHLLEYIFGSIGAITVKIV